MTQLRQPQPSQPQDLSNGGNQPGSSSKRQRVEDQPPQTQSAQAQLDQTHRYRASLPQAQPELGGAGRRVTSALVTPYRSPQPPQPQGSSTGGSQPGSSIKQQRVENQDGDFFERVSDLHVRAAAVRQKIMADSQYREIFAAHPRVNDQLTALRIVADAGIYRAFYAIEAELKKVVGGPQQAQGQPAQGQPAQGQPMPGQPAHGHTAQE
ncbi:uncharacterized protein LTR77_008325 [Saxophila tyrrhenica]|uniref:Uncharacterized protein n=1 Tax=Saxophila tyrrhenica TaxID=1690608 RepID=A0AAV9P2J8_9PEZI|nr:hypothetical protein LTR77_008325 [Saxophila tyrrhenica]